MNSNTCGFPFCAPGDQPHFISGQEIPDIIIEHGLQEHLTEMMETIDKIMRKTGQPPCPLNILTIMMFPLCCLSPVCYIAAKNHNKRLVGITEAKQKFNENYGKST